VKWIRCTQPLFRLAGLNIRGGKRRELFIFYFKLNAFTPGQNPSVKHGITAEGIHSIIRSIPDWQHLGIRHYII
jgi:hypothetical protein